MPLELPPPAPLSLYSTRAFGKFTCTIYDDFLGEELECEFIHYICKSSFEPIAERNEAEQQIKLKDQLSTHVEHGVVGKKSTTQTDFALFPVLEYRKHAFI